MSKANSGPPLPKPRPLPLVSKNRGTLEDLGNYIDRHSAAWHEFLHEPARSKFLEELREIQEDIRNWEIIPRGDLSPNNHSILHDLWTKAVGTPGYDKAAWVALESALKSVSTWQPQIKRAAPSMQEEQVQFHLRCIAGRVLTLVDALISDPTQRKAFKTYVKKEFREEFCRVERKFREWRSGGGSEESEPEELTVANAEFGR